MKSGFSELVRAGRANRIFELTAAIPGGPDDRSFDDQDSTMRATRKRPETGTSTIRRGSCSSGVVLRGSELAAGKPTTGDETARGC
jgi:hypothetical protein